MYNTGMDLKRKKGGRMNSGFIRLRLGPRAWVRVPEKCILPHRPPTPHPEHKTVEKEKKHTS